MMKTWKLKLNKEETKRNNWLKDNSEALKTVTKLTKVRELTENNSEKSKKSDKENEFHYWQSMIEVWWLETKRKINRSKLWNVSEKSVEVSFVQSFSLPPQILKSKSNNMKRKLVEVPLSGTNSFLYFFPFFLFDSIWFNCWFFFGLWIFENFEIPKNSKLIITSIFVTETIAKTKARRTSSTPFFHSSLKHSLSSINWVNNKDPHSFSL